MNITQKNFIDWLGNRLEYKYNENKEILQALQVLKDNFIFVPKKINTKFVDEICKKHYVDFDMEKSPDLNMGFTEGDRMRIRNFVLDVISSISRLDS